MTKIKAKNYKCFYCDKGFYHYWQLRDHNLIKPCGPYTCHYCRKNFLSCHSLQSHLLSFHLCLFSDAQVPIKRETMGFDKMLDPEKNHSDYSTELDTGKDIASNNMLITDRFNDNLSENSLELMTKSPKNLPDISTMDQKNFTYRCKVCADKFQDEVSLDVHTKSHPLKLYACNICLKNFSSIWQLKSHNNDAHVFRTAYTCALCGCKYKTSLFLKQHIKSDHPRYRSLITVRSSNIHPTIASPSIREKESKDNLSESSNLEHHFYGSPKSVASISFELLKGARVVKQCVTSSNLQSEPCLSNSSIYPSFRSRLNLAPSRLSLHKCKSIFKNSDRRTIDFLNHIPQVNNYFPSFEDSHLVKKKWSSPQDLYGCNNFMMNIARRSNGYINGCLHGDELHCDSEIISDDQGGATDVLNNLFMNNYYIDFLPEASLLKHNIMARHERIRMTNEPCHGRSFKLSKDAALRNKSNLKSLTSDDYTNSEIISRAWARVKNEISTESLCYGISFGNNHQRLGLNSQKDAKLMAGHIPFTSESLMEIKWAHPTSICNSAVFNINGVQDVIDANIVNRSKNIFEPLSPKNYDDSAIKVNLMNEDRFFKNQIHYQNEILKNISTPISVRGTLNNRANGKIISKPKATFLNSDTKYNTSFPPSICPECGAKLKNKSSLKFHLQRQHPKGELFNCPMCPKSFGKQWMLRNHLMTHKDKYPCSYCG
ncbi:unnamed protein product [Gordionus sp. m RMFG-2023]